MRKAQGQIGLVYRMHQNNIGDNSQEGQTYARSKLLNYHSDEYNEKSHNDSIVLERHRVEQWLKWFCEAGGGLT